MEDERIGTRLRLDNFAILLYLTDNRDPEVRDCFEEHMMLVSQQRKGFTDEQSKLVSQLNSKTEETFQALLEKYLTNDEYNMIRNLRSMKDDGYQTIFKMVIDQGPALFNIEYLMHNLKSFAQNKLKLEIHMNQAKSSGLIPGGFSAGGGALPGLGGVNTGAGGYNNYGMSNATNITNLSGGAQQMNHQPI
mmetsp:Transcript_2351/g.3545  ORF Transcript_2351/g.3545 Transcript_2351/m.3545 type:complete len:191 (+) Transcript_2351:2901-3473(+)